MWTKNDMPDQSGKKVMVTGANAGIGFETALAFYEKGAHVILAGRNLTALEQASGKIRSLKGNGSLEIAVVDLSSLEAIRQFASQFLSTHSSLDILINNAGVMIPPEWKTTDGYELQIGVNFLGHFLLTGYLYPLLAAQEGSRIVTVSSMAYLRGKIDFSNFRSENSYDAMREYCQSKLANILFSLELHRRISKANGNVLSVATQPGANKTELVRHMSEEDYNAALERFGELMEPWQGALPSLMAATWPGVKGGDFYSPDKDGGIRGYPVLFPLEPHALDKAVAKQLWEWAEHDTGFSYSF
ncbi:oxidoreductase [Terrimonas sp. NA20]|uniref:Oxidoreductase n=1 Tax=Terrimonas ginsenosidimutans TaxID=2908004 RepID=A0ABS9KWW9_9BACT|nr:oxidoreductase [Terrimonas ginsenosidimutans]MCG2616815.1 oxidoreductase [Terrimonas ginsenosidimutans]